MHRTLDVAGQPAAKDAASITGAQKVEHYEIASYGALRTFAQMLGHPDVAELLQRTLDQEAQTDTVLTILAEESINRKTV